MKYLANFEKQNNNVIRNSLIGAGVVGTGLATGAALLRGGKGSRVISNLAKNSASKKTISNNEYLKPVRSTEGFLTSKPQINQSFINNSSPVGAKNVEPVEDFRIDAFRTELENNPLLQLQYVNSIAKGAKKGKQAVTRRRMQLETMPEYLDLKDKRIAKRGKNAGNIKKTRAKGKNKKERENAINEIKKRKQALVQKINSDREMGSYFNNYNIKNIRNF